MKSATQSFETRRKQCEAKNKTSPLLKLPGELRNHIYDLVIPKDKIFTTYEIAATYTVDAAGTEHRCSTIQRRRPFRRHFAVTQVCKQLRKDTLKLAYGSNTFELRAVVDDEGRMEAKYTIAAAENWLKTRPPEALSALSRVILQSWDVRSAIAVIQKGFFDVHGRVAQSLDVTDADLFAYCEHRLGACENLPFKAYGLMQKSRAKKVLQKVDESTLRDDPEKAFCQLVHAFSMSTRLRPAMRRLVSRLDRQEILREKRSEEELARRRWR